MKFSSKNFEYQFFDDNNEHGGALAGIVSIYSSMLEDRIFTFGYVFLDSGYTILNGTCRWYQINELGGVSPKGIRTFIIGVKGHLVNHDQCDQIGRFFKVFGYKFSNKRSPNIW